MKRNIELTKGLIFSQRVMLALIDKGLSRQKAYQLVQRNAMKAWKQSKNFLGLLKADPEVTATLPPEELEPLFDEQYYLRYIDSIFKRLGLTETQWKEKTGIVEATELAPRAV
jgi:adenylosuccinate lyase